MTVPPGRSSLTAMLGAGLAAILASVCCLVPLLLVLAGISGAGIASLTALDAWRPWFSGFALLCMVWAFWVLYGPAVRCRVDIGCVDFRQLRRRRRWFWFATMLVGLLLLFPYYIGWLL